jgi:TolB-like protein
MKWPVTRARIEALIAELKERRLAQFFGGYVVFAWFFLQAVDQVADRGVVPELVYRVALTLVLASAPGILIITWFHGQKGQQRVRAMEIWLLGVVAIFALGASGFVVRLELDGGEARAPAPEAWEDPKRVAVLYFDTRGGGDDAHFIAAGLTEGLIDELSAVDALHVISRHGAEMFRDTQTPDDSVARNLGVGTLVRGQVAMAGEQVRVTISLIEGSTGRQLASERIERSRANLFELQDSLATHVALLLRQRIGQEVERLEARSGTRNVQAWELVQRAERTAGGAAQLAEAGNIAGATAQLMAADSLLARAESLDPQWSLPATRRGWLAYRQARLFGLNRGPQDEPTLRGLVHAERALERNPRDADALELRGTLHYWRTLLNLVDHREEHHLVDRAAADLRAAVAENPRQASALASLSHLLLNNGDIPQAKLAAYRSYEADPFLSNANVTLWRLASTSWELADHTEARKWCDEGLRRFPHDYRFRQCQLMLFALRDQTPDVPAAWSRMREFVESSPHHARALTERQGLMYMAMALVRANLPDSADAVARRGRAGPDIDPLREVAWIEAIMRTWLGQYDEAVRQLGLHISANPAVLEGFRGDARRGRIDKWYFDGLVDQPAFRELVGVR